MNRKRGLTYGLLGGLLIVTALVFYFYQEYMGEDTDPNATHLANPLINKRLNAVVLRTESINAGSQPKLGVEYKDLDTEEAASFTVPEAYRQTIHVGDTVTKDKGEKLLFIYQKAGRIETVPID